MIEREVLSSEGLLEVVVVQRIAGYAALLEPGTVDPVQAKIVATARAVASGQVLVCEPGTGSLVFVDADVEPDMFDEDVDEPVELAGGESEVPPVPSELLELECALEPECPHLECVGGEFCAAAQRPGVLGKLDHGVSDENAEMHRSECAAECCEYMLSGYDEIVDYQDVSDRGGRPGSASLPPAPSASEVSDEPGVRVPRRLPDGFGELPGGAELAKALEAVQLGEIGAYELVEFVAACQRMSSAMDALQASAVSELSHRVEMRPAEGVRAESMSTGRITVLEVGARLMTSDDAAGQLVSRAWVVCERLPDTFALWRAGVLPTEKVDVLVTKLGRVDTDLAREVEAWVLPGATTRTTQSLRRQITRLLHKLAPKAAKKRHQEAKAERFVRITPAPDGMAWLEAYLSTEDAAAVKAVLDAGAATLKRHDDAFFAAPSTAAQSGQSGSGAHAAVEPDEAGAAQPGASPVAQPGEAAADDMGQADEMPRRTAANRRADVLAALAWAALDAGTIGGCGHTSSATAATGPGTPSTVGNAVGQNPAFGAPSPVGGFGLSSVRGRAVAVNVTVPLTTLLGETDEPGELAGFGSVSAEAARLLAAHGTWRRIVTDPLSGAVLDVGRTRYTPPRDLADHVMARDQRCVWPTCDRPASAAGIQLDHTIAFEDGGATAHTNLGVFCDKNHVDKHQAGWTVTQPEPGRFVFLSPTGHVYSTELEPVGPTPDREAGKGSMPEAAGVVRTGEPSPF